MNNMVIGLLPLNQLDTFISNLQEQNVPDSAISVITNPPAMSRNFTDLTGSLQNRDLPTLLAKLTDCGMPKNQANQLLHQLNQTTAIVAIDLDAADWLNESFTDHQATDIWSSHVA